MSAAMTGIITSLFVGLMLAIFKAKLDEKVDLIKQRDAIKDRLFEEKISFLKEAQKSVEKNLDSVMNKVENLNVKTELVLVQLTHTADAVLELKDFVMKSKR